MSSNSPIGLLGASLLSLVLITSFVVSLATSWIFSCNIMVIVSSQISGVSTTFASHDVIFHCFIDYFLGIATSLKSNLFFCSSSSRESAMVYRTLSLYTKP